MSTALERFLAEHPLIEEVDLLVPDLAGIARGKRLDLEGLRRALAGGLTLPSTIYSLDTAGNNVEASPLVWGEGDADRPLRVAPETLAPVPWRPGRAQILGGLREQDGGPFYADPRTVLAALEQRLEAQGLRPVVAFEYEFYLLDAALDPRGRPQLAASRRHGGPPSAIEVYSLERLEDEAAFLDTLGRFAEALGLGIEATSAEFAPGQFEVNLRHTCGAVRAADRAFVFERCVRAAAEAVGRRATFMAKPFAELSGSGMHLHLSLADPEGNNLFGRGREGEELLGRAIAGVLRLMPDCMLFFAPNANSYRRLQPLSYAPIAACWGHNNRTVAVRVPPARGPGRRFEHRLAGADANPYLVLAAVLAGVLEGLARGEPPPPPVEGNAYERCPPDLPLSWERAIAAFADSPALSRWFDRRFLDLYRICRDSERARYRREIPDRDYAWYLSAV